MSNKFWEKYGYHVGAIFVAVMGSFMLFLTASQSDAATAIEYGCLSQAGLDTGTSAVTIVDGCLVKVMDEDENVACYVTPQGGVSCVKLQGN